MQSNQRRHMCYIMEDLWAKPTFLAAKVSIILFLLHCSLHIKAFAHHLLGRRSIGDDLETGRLVEARQTHDVRACESSRSIVRPACSQMLLMHNYTEAIISWTTPSEDASMQVRPPYCYCATLLSHALIGNMVDLIATVILQENITQLKSSYRYLLLRNFVALHIQQQCLLRF